MAEARVNDSARRAAGRIAALYLLIGGGWILLSDAVLSALFPEPGLFEILGLGKGVAYAVVTAGLTYYLVHRELVLRSDQRTQIRLEGERLRLALDASGEGVWEWSRNGGGAAWDYSDGMFRMLGYDPATASGKPEFFLDLAHPDDRARLQELVRQVPDSSVDRVETECRLRAADGTWHWILCRGVCAERGTDGKPVRVVGTHSDCTNLRLLEDRHLRLEDQLFQQQRLECIEAIAGGVAHEINDPINGIMNDAELISDRLGPDCETARFAQGIVRETQRVAPIIGDLLAFARAEPESPEPVRVQDMVNSALALTGTLLRHHQVMVEVNIPADLPDLTCRRRQILQVLINLVLNSTDALDARFPSADPRKRLGIRTEVFEEEGHTWLSLIVEDSGCGIPPAVRERIFEPFYTSGTDGHRTGLGLAVSLDIVRRHKGRIRVESQEGESTSFAVDLPLAAAPVCAWTE